MSIIEILTGINSYTFTILFILFLATFIKKYYFTGILFLRTILVLIMAFFLFVGWGTLDYDRYVNNKNKQVTFPKNYFVEVCNLKKLYNNENYSFYGREESYKYDCFLSAAEDFLSSYENDEFIMKEGIVKYVDSTKVFTIVDSFTTNSIGLGASFGGNGVRFYILKSNSRSYLLWESNLKYGEIK